MSRETLPHQTTSFVGRTDELRDIAERLANPACWLLTLVGPGGIGKTRLALEVAAHYGSAFEHGVFFIPLASVASPDRLVSTMAEALGITLSPAENPVQQVARHLQKKKLLLLMDNVEHLLQGVEVLSELLQAVPSLKILTTSREKLNLREEWVFALEGLSFPTASSTVLLESYSAVQLFVQRARQVQAHFSLSENAEAVQKICQQVEGMPLGLELAATWLRVLSCSQIVTQISQGLDFLTTPLRNVPERHRSLRVVFEQSWNLLSASEQAVFMKLSVFRGGFDLHAARQVAGASLPLLAALADKSFIRSPASGRYDLHELLRQYAADKLLEADLLTTAQQQHYNYFLDLAEQADAHRFGAEQVIWYDRLETELDNLRAALGWSADQTLGLRLAAALGWFFSERYHWLEGYGWLERILTDTPDAPPSLRAHVLHRTAALAAHLGEVQQTRTLCSQVLELASAINDRWSAAWALSHLGFSGDYPLDQGIEMLDQSVALFREIKDPEGLTHALIRRSFFAFNQEDYPHALKLAQAVENVAQTAGDRVMLGWALFLQGKICWEEKRDFDQTRLYYETSLSLFRQAHFQIGLNTAHISMATAQQAVGNIRNAQMFQKAALLSLQVLSPYHNYLLSVLVGLAHVAEARGQYERATHLLGAVSNRGVPPQLDNAEVLIFNSVSASVRVKLGETTFAEAWAVGKAMTSDQAAAYAMESEMALTAPPVTQELPTPLNPLTKRELEILHLVADGLSNREISQRLFFTVNTVKWYLSEIYAKLGVHTRVQAIARAREQRLIT